MNKRFEVRNTPLKQCSYGTYYIHDNELSRVQPMFESVFCSCYKSAERASYYMNLGEEKRIGDTNPNEEYTAAALEAVSELTRALEKWPKFNSAHEGFAVLNEEFDELKEHVWMNQKKRDLPAMREEAIQVAAMAIRFAVEVCDETRGRV